MEVEQGALSRMEALLSAEQQSLPPAEAPGAGLSFQNYLRVIDSYRVAEKDHEIYSTDFDLCISYIDADIQRDAFRDGIKAMHMEDNAVVWAAMEQMYKIQTQRFQNMFSKRKVTHLVVSEQGFRAFVKSGKLDNEVDLLRPFTIAERIKILENLYKQTTSNPYFTIYFFKMNGLPEMQVSITHYVDYGMAFVRRNEPYNLAGTDVDGFVHKISFGDVFCRFIREEFIGNQDRVMQNSALFLKQQIDLLKRMQARERQVT